MDKDEAEEESFELSPEDEVELLLSIAEADTGTVIPGDEFLGQLWKRGS